MQSLHKSKTAALPHRIMNKTSIYLAKQSKVDRDDFLGYEAIVKLENNQIITIQSEANITAQDGKVFEYVLSQWQATQKVQPDLKSIEVNIESIVNVLGWNNRTENRKKVIKNLEKILKVTITYKWNSGETLFHLLDTLVIIDSTKSIAIQVAETYSEALEIAGCRYINVSSVMALRGKYEVELYKLLQMRGSGVYKKKPQLVKRISHSNICEHLHLDKNVKVSKDIVSRAFKTLRDMIQCPQYHYNNRRGEWEINT